MRKRLTVLTVGCKANFADSASIVREAVSAGFDIIPNARQADVVVINSCTVTHRADRDSRYLVRRARRDNPSASLVFTGCFAQTSLETKEKIPDVDYWVGIAEEGTLGTVLRRIGSGCDESSPHLTEYAAALLLGRRRMFLKIQDGCDFACAYCVVPIARGKNRSLPQREIIEKAAAAEADGARELVITGIHIGLYGTDRSEKEGLARLVADLLAETAGARIRLSSIEPMELTDELLERIACHPRVCRHLHVPLQSGSNSVLDRMRRPYHAARYASVIEGISVKMPDAQIGADVIVGFPGESKKDFEETVRVLESLPIHYLHVFPYSPRPGTESAKFRDDVSSGTKKERVARLLRMDERKRRGYLESQTGKELEILVESANSVRGELSGYSGNYVEVFFPGDIGEIGTLTSVRTVSIHGKGLYGRREGGNV